MTTDSTPAARVAAIAEAAGLTFAAAFVPYSASRHAVPAPGQDKPWQSLNWRVTIQRNGRDVIATEYAQGVAHAPAYSAPVSTHGGQHSLLREKALLIELETGRRATPAIGRVDQFAPGAPLDPPSLVDVLASLAQDASAIDSPTFEAWADEYGYSTDSRSAESTYRACLSHGLALRAALGDVALADLRDAAGEL